VSELVPGPSRVPKESPARSTNASKRPLVTRTSSDRGAQTGSERLTGTASPGRKPVFCTLLGGPALSVPDHTCSNTEM
jgi:hypothetical protein